MAEFGWLVLGAGVGYGGLAIYAIGLVIRTRRARHAVRQLQAARP